MIAASAIRNHVETLKFGEKAIKIMRVVKQGTERVFFYPETLDGKRLTTRVFARKYDAVNLAYRWLEK